MEKNSKSKFSSIKKYYLIRLTIVSNIFKIAAFEGLIKLQHNLFSIENQKL